MRDALPREPRRDASTGREKPNDKSNGPAQLNFIALSRCKSGLARIALTFEPRRINAGWFTRVSIRVRRCSSGDVRPETLRAYVAQLGENSMRYAHCSHENIGWPEIVGRTVVSTERSRFPRSK